MRPLIGLPADRQLVDVHQSHVVGEKYLAAAAEFAGGVPVMLPALPQWVEPEVLLARLDGLLLTGARSNIEPHHYGAQPIDATDPRDPARDATTLRLIPAAIARGMPVLGICRGLQELNVALGGSLCQRLHEQPGRLDHRAVSNASVDDQYGPAHVVTVEEGGLLARVIGGGTHTVNSVHGQGIDRLAPGLRVEAAAADGLIEAVAFTEPRQFVLAVQWHPEWQPALNPSAQAIFSAFGKACRDYANGKFATFT